jgi:uncharacterized integral membrane protein
MYMVGGALIVLFASQNLDMVNVYLIIGAPVEVPLVIVVGLSFMGGFIAAIMLVLRKAVRRQTNKSSTEIMRR